MNTSSPPASATDIDDIMSSIRSGVETEATKPPSGSADLLEQAAAQEMAAEAASEDADDDVLELTAADMTPAASMPATSGPEANPMDILGVPGLSSADEAADEFDKLLAEISIEKQTRAAEVAAVKEALLADIEPLGEIPASATMPETEPMPEAQPETATVDPMTVREDTVMNSVAVPTPMEVAHTVGMVADGSGAMQLTLPAEVLAMALRPMVQDWLNANLAGVVERLVQAEIAKLNG